MPQIDCYYPKEISPEESKVYHAVESLITASDSKAGVCKIRLHAVDKTKPKHVYLIVALLDKPHRDEEFMQTLASNLAAKIKPIFSDVLVSVEIRFLARAYTTIS